MSPQQVLEGFFSLEIIAISNGAGAALFVHRLDSLIVLLGDRHSAGWLLDEKGVMGISSRVRLGLKERIKVPEGRLDPLVGGHFVKAHFHQNVAKLGPYLYIRETEK